MKKARDHFFTFKNLAQMRTYQSTKQFTIAGFETPFENNLLDTNRWVKLGDSIPWDECVEIYLKKLSSKMGRPAIDARIAVGALLIKHLKGISDREVVDVIQENLYLQYFVGFSSFQPQPAFDPSLMVTLRKRMGQVEFDKMNDLIIRKALNLPAPEADLPEAPSDEPNSNQSSPASGATSENSQGASPEGASPESRFLKRNLKTINQLWDEIDSPTAPFNSFRDLRIFWVINLLFDQQTKMYEDRVNRHDDRIVNIYQPYVRPIVRGKEKHKVEFGAKIGASEFDGFMRLDHLSWDAYNESGDLINQVERYRQLTGFYPELLLVDKIYMTRKNRKYLKEKNIRHVGKPLGKPKEITPYQKRKQKKERGMRNHIEGKFGQGKNTYELKTVRTRRADTSASWIACIVFVINLVRWEKIMPLILILAHWFCIFFFARNPFVRRTRPLSNNGK